MRNDHTDAGPGSDGRGGGADFASAADATYANEARDMAAAAMLNRRAKVLWLWRGMLATTLVLSVLSLALNGAMSRLEPVRGKVRAMQGRRRRRGRPGRRCPSWIDQGA